MFAFKVALSLLAASLSVSAHTFVYSVNGNVNAVRVLPSERNFPLKDLRSNDIICGKNAPSKAQSVAQVTAGQAMTLQYYHEGPGPQDMIIDASHIGPCLVYLAKYTEDPRDAQWFKIYEDGYNGNWCVLKLIQNRGVLSVPVPKELENGRYIMRADVIALHEADVSFNVNSARGAQYYPHCADIEVTGGQGQKPSSTVPIPGFMTAEDNVFNVYNGQPYSNYVVPPPAMVTFQAAQPDTPVTSAPTQPATNAPNQPIADAPTTQPSASPTKPVNSEEVESSATSSTISSMIIGLVFASHFFQ